MSVLDEERRLAVLREEREEREDAVRRLDRVREMSSWRDEQREAVNRRARVGLRGGVTVTLAGRYVDVAHAVSGARNTGVAELVFARLDGEMETFAVADILGVHEVRP